MADNKKSNEEIAAEKVVEDEQAREAQESQIVQDEKVALDAKTSESPVDTVDPSADPSVSEDSSVTTNEPSGASVDPPADDGETNVDPSAPVVSTDSSTDTAPVDNAEPEEAAPVDEDPNTDGSLSGESLPHGVVPDQVQINQSLAQLGNDLNAFQTRVNALLGAFYDHSGLDEIITSAADWVAEAQGMVKQDDGTWAVPEAPEAIDTSTV